MAPQVSFALRNGSADSERRDQFEQEDECEEYFRQHPDGGVTRDPDL
jgi:hypothetical protein